MAAAEPGLDVDAPEAYLNRELTWLAYAFRVLAEADDPRNPPLERARFLAISGSHVDSFYMKRIGGLMQQVATGLSERTVDGRTPAEQIAQCRAALRRMEVEQQRVLRGLVTDLAAAGVHLLDVAELSQAERAALRERYLTDIFPLVTPHAMSPSHPFPHVSNLSLNLLVSVRRAPGEPISLARVKVPLGHGTPRFLRVGEGHRYVPLEQVLTANLDLPFPDLEIVAVETFRVTRNANTERDEEESDDLLETIRTELRDRKLAPIVRLQVAEGMEPSRRAMIAGELDLDDRTEVDASEGLLSLRDLGEIAELDLPELRAPPHLPVAPPRLRTDPSFFHGVRRRGPILVHHPYESFDASVLRMLRECATDPKVLAVKMTLYRADREVIARLLDAARAGTHVTVVMELKARFDESRNIAWVQRLEEHGINVTYGVVGLKTYCKLILVVRRDYDGLRRYAHIGSGNYHSGTARVYGDVGLFTRDDDVGRDVSELFNYLTTGFEPDRAYRKLLVAPVGLKEQLLQRIEREIRHHQEGGEGLVRIKVNALEDADIVRALYRASRAGVRVDLVVRDTCRLRPGVPGVSESARVVSVVGRFLEHARVFHFGNGGDEEWFIGSADCMRRNLEHRVEVLVPVEDEPSREELRFLLDAQLADARGGWQMAADGTWTRIGDADSAAPSSQARLAARARQRLEDDRQRRRRRLPTARAGAS